MAEKKREYSNDELTVVWKPEKCVHSGVCVKMLPEVYDPEDQPWIKPDQASNTALQEQIDRCPSGALTYYLNEGAKATKSSDENKVITAVLMENGPLLITGDISLKHPDGRLESNEGTTAFCRCGASSNKPFCDGAHSDSGFKG